MRSTPSWRSPALLGLPAALALAFFVSCGPGRSSGRCVGDLGGVSVAAKLSGVDLLIDDNDMYNFDNAYTRLEFGGDQFVVDMTFRVPTTEEFFTLTDSNPAMWISNRADGGLSPREAGHFVYVSVRGAQQVLRTGRLEVTDAGWDFTHGRLAMGTEDAGTTAECTFEAYGTNYKDTGRD